MPTRRRATPARKEAPPTPQPDWAYFLDFDGTLLDLAPAPWLVRMDPELHDLIEELTEFAGGAVAVISGRSIADVDSFFTAGEIPVAGQHGLEHRDATGRTHRHGPDASRMDGAVATIEAAARRHPGLLLEHKGLSVALHYRKAPRLGGFAHRLLRSLQRRLGPDYTLQSGKYIVELKPSGRNKGNALREFMREPPFRNRTPVFIGDDTTDEHAFAVTNELGGLSIKVGPGRTAARYRLQNVPAVRSWLKGGMHAGPEARILRRSRAS